ncbi:capsular polysaccharide export protein, LipB/KpsS family [Xanthobacter agilis]|uniref:capsular polysaccharide export protein, LipB/KpsS family n=1 Tax=Xanthobacter agilis TaxID=47492 RepID=UPI003729A77B
MNILAKLLSDASPALKRLLGTRPRPAAEAAGAVPGWYRPHVSAETQRVLSGPTPVFLYLPWIAEHTDALVARLGTHAGYALAPFDMFTGVEDNATRREIFRVALEETDVYRKLVARRLVQVRRHIRGIIFTFDWAPVTRIIANVCEDLEIPKILIPHESVFINRDKYYWDPAAKASLPMADVVLGWGRLQQDIFLERGYSADRFRAVGAPKFDPYVNARPALTRAQFCRLFGLRPERKLIVFASQPLDSQLDREVALEVQRRAMADLLTYAEGHGCQLLVRLPPSKDDVLGPELRARLARSPVGAFDDAMCYLVPPEEAVCHADAVASINSTMLFEAVLLGRPALSMKYLEFDQVWEKVGIPAVTDAAGMAAKLDVMLARGWDYPPEGLAWAADMFGIGSFDGRASARISAYLAALAADETVLTLRPNAIARLFARDTIDVVGVPPVAALSPERQPHLLGLLHARTRVDSGAGVNRLRAIASVDLFLQWGADASAVADRQREAARAIGRPVAVVEEGFIGPVSLILDDTTAYYDATDASRLERWLADGPELSAPERARAQAAMDRIVTGRLTKTGGGDALSPVGRPGVRKILVVDQPLGDPAVTLGLADKAAFARMLDDALARGEGCDIIVKACAGAGGAPEAGHLAPDRLAALQGAANVHVVTIDANSYALLEGVDEVFVVSAHLGFEACLAGKKVHCHGVPFYAGWGFTQDHADIPRRTRRRTVAEVFHAAYILQSRYYDPRRGAAVELEDVLDALGARG